MGLSVKYSFTTNKLQLSTKYMKLTIRKDFLNTNELFISVLTKYKCMNSFFFSPQNYSNSSNENNSFT